MNWLEPTTWADADRERLNLLPVGAPENYFPKHSEPTTACVRLPSHIRFNSLQSGEA